LATIIAANVQKPQKMSDINSSKYRRPLIAYSALLNRCKNPKHSVGSMCIFLAWIVQQFDPWVSGKGSIYFIENLKPWHYKIAIFK
jgi:hypothetical protein